MSICCAKFNFNNFVTFSLHYQLEKAIEEYGFIMSGPYQICKKKQKTQ